MASLVDRINMGLASLAKEPLAEKEIFNFLGFLTAGHYYDKSPTVLTSPDQSGNFGPAARLMGEPRFMEIIHALSHSTEHTGHVLLAGEDDRWAPPPERVVELQQAIIAIGALGQKIAYLAGNTEISLGELKWNLRSHMAGHTGLLKVFRRGASAGPISLAAVSKDTNMLLAASFVLLGDSITDVALELAVKSTNPVGRLTNANFHNAMFAVDRQLFQPSFITPLLAHNGGVVGTMSQGNTSYPVAAVKHSRGTTGAAAAGQAAAQAAGAGGRGRGGAGRGGQHGPAVS